jgi:hypothetical protein
MRFFREVHRVLTPAGSFCYTDVMPVWRFGRFERDILLKFAGFELLSARNITENVMQAIVRNMPLRRELFDEVIRDQADAKSYLDKLYDDVAIRSLRRYMRGEDEYRLWHLRKR